MAMFSKWKRVYVILLDFQNDLAEDFKKIFSPKVFNYNVREALLFFSAFTQAIYAVSAKNINIEAQNRLASLNLNNIFEYHCPDNNPSFNKLLLMLEERQNEVIEIIAKSVSGKSEAEEALQEITGAVYKNIFDNDEEQYEIVHPLLFNMIGEHISKALNSFNR